MIMKYVEKDLSRFDAFLGGSLRKKSKTILRFQSQTRTARREKLIIEIFMQQSSHDEFITIKKFMRHRGSCLNNFRMVFLAL